MLTFKNKKGDIVMRESADGKLEILEENLKKQIEEETEAEENERREED